MCSPAQKQSFFTRFCYEMSVLDDLGIPLTIPNLCIIWPQTRHYNKEHHRKWSPYCKTFKHCKPPPPILWWKFRALKPGGKSVRTFLVTSVVHCWKWHSGEKSSLKLKIRKYRYLLQRWVLMIKTSHLNSEPHVYSIISFIQVAFPIYQIPFEF